MVRLYFLISILFSNINFVWFKNPSPLNENKSSNKKDYNSEMDEVEIKYCSLKTISNFFQIVLQKNPYQAWNSQIEIL